MSPLESHYREADSTVAFDLRHFHLWHDQYARRACTILAVCHYTCRDLCAFLQHYWILIHQVWLPRLGDEDPTIVEMASPEAES